MFCKNCGKDLEEGTKYCPNCGTEVQKTKTEPPFTENPFAWKNPEGENGQAKTQSQSTNTTNASAPIDEDYIEAYLNGNGNCSASQMVHYKTSFRKLEKGNVANWNWATFFFGGWHLIYRKTYLFGLLFLLGASMLTSTVIAPIIISVVAGIFGDFFIYKRFITKKNEAMEKYSTKTQQLEYLRDFGGTNKWVIILGIIISIIYLVLAFVLTGLIFGSSFLSDYYY